MKNFSTTTIVAVICAATGLTTPDSQAQFVYETDLDLITTGDFNGDGLTDLALISRDKGRVRIGYRLSGEFFNWVNWRGSGMKGVTGVSIGKIVDAKYDSLALTSADENRTAIVSAANPNAETDPIKIPPSTLGPMAIVAADLGGAGNTPLLDLYLASIYNADPTPNKLTLLRNANGKITQAAELVIPAAISRANRLALKKGGPEFVVELAKGDKGNELRAEKLDSGKPEEVLSIGDLPSSTDYVVGYFSNPSLLDIVFFTPGETELKVARLEEAGGKFKAAPLKTITLPRSVQTLVTIPGEKQSRLLAIYGIEEPAEVLDFDAAKAPVAVQQLTGATNRFLSAAIALPDVALLFSYTDKERPKSVSHYQMYLLKEGKYVAGAFGALASLDDRDEVTIPEIHKLILATSKEKTQADMKGYTNNIPGSPVPYMMVPIPGGEFTMGSPDNEKDRKPDEGPQHKVKISPFWMGQFEVTWDQYLLFLYPDDEKNLRKEFKDSAKVDAVSDIVTRPSKPYVDMSFGMGKKAKRGGIGFPAIAMTQHAANKFCHWLSAKTGHFYRLPTEAEWEYACRAGTATAYYFGNDARQLTNYAWYFDNSNSKYQEVGKKQPNAWGLHDMCGNVTEWVLDQYDDGYYKTLAGKTLISDPWNRATKPYPHSVRGGSWDDDPKDCRSAARRGSDRSWKMTDPQLPKGMWWMTDAQFIGFRIVRPLTTPSPEEMAKYWISGVERE